MRRIAIATIYLLAATAAGAQPGPGAGGPPAVGVMGAERRPVTESSEFTGRIEAVNRVDIRARVTGFLQERAFQEGQEVRAGSVLFRLERAPFEAALEQARANVASAQAQLENGRVALQRARELRQTGAGTQVALLVAPVLVLVRRCGSRKSTSPTPRSFRLSTARSAAPP